MELAEKPHEFVKHQMAEKQNAESYVAKLYQQANGTTSAQEESRIRWSAAALYTGGADTVGRPQT